MSRNHIRIVLRSTARHELHSLSGKVDPLKRPKCYGAMKVISIIKDEASG
jgi:hypothetical protein